MISRRQSDTLLLPVELRGEVMTLQQVAKYLNCHYSTAFRLVHSGTLPAFRLGGDWRFRRSDIEKWIADRQVQAARKSVRRTVRRKLAPR